MSTTPPTPPFDPLTTLWPAVAACAVIFIIYASRELYTAFTQTHEQQVKVEAQRLMLRFCKNPTQKRFEAAWRYIEENDVWVSELDQGIVKRFNSIAGEKELLG